MENLDKYRLFLIDRKTNKFDKGGFENELNKALKDNPEFDTPEWRDYFTSIALQESRFNKNAKNKASSAYGYFLLLKANRKTGDLFKDMFALTKSNMNILKSKLSANRIKQLNLEGYSIPQLLALAHFLGANGAVKYLNTGLYTGGTGNPHPEKYISAFNDNYNGNNIRVTKSRDGNKVMAFAPSAYDNSIRVQLPVMQQEAEPLVYNNDYSEVALQPIIVDENNFTNLNNPMLDEVVVTGNKSQELPLFASVESYHELPLVIVQPLQFREPAKQTNLLLQAFNELIRQQINLALMHGDIYDLYLSQEEANKKRQDDLRSLLFAEQMSKINVSALGGLLYDFITNTYNPNNKIGDMHSKSIMPNVRY